MKRIVERLNESSIVDESGDVVPFADFAGDFGHRIMANPARTERIGKHRRDYDREIEEYEQEQAAIEATRSLADFSARNDYLSRMARKIGESNRHAGAAKKMEFGGRVTRYRDADHAEALAIEVHGVAKHLGEMACANCPLIDVCDIAPGEIVGQLSARDVRDRFKRRVENPENNHICETNMQPGRQDSMQV